MNSPYFQEGNIPPLCEDFPVGAYWGPRDRRSPSDLLRTPPKFWLRPWRVRLTRPMVLDEMVEQFKAASIRAKPLTLNNSLIIKTELLSAADFDAIFNPDWRWLDGSVYRAIDASKAILSKIYEKTQVL